MVGEMCVGCDFDESRRATCEGTEASWQAEYVIVLSA